MRLPPTSAPYYPAYTGDQGTSFPSPDNISAFPLANLKWHIKIYLWVFETVCSGCIYSNFVFTKKIQIKNLQLKNFIRYSYLMLFQVFFLRNYFIQWSPFLPAFSFYLDPVQP